MVVKKIPNIQIESEEGKEFNHQIKRLNNTYTNILISKVSVKVPDLDDYHITNFDIDYFNLQPPATFKRINVSSIHMRKIEYPEYKEYHYWIKPFNDNMVHIENIYRPQGEAYYRNTKVTSANKFPKIEIDFDEKINLNKW